jgi:hypothetical protein
MNLVDSTADLAHATDEQVQQVLRQLTAMAAEGKALDEDQLGAILRHLVERAHLGGDRAWKRLTEGSRAAAVALYVRLGPASRWRHLLLQLLAVSRGPDDLRAFAELAVRDPPTDATAAAVAVGPLFQQRNYDPSLLFPQLLDALASPVWAPLVMDLANYVTREGLVARHPALDKLESLKSLLGGLVHRLGKIEERPSAASDDARKLSETVSLSISLAVSLCDALGMIGDPSAAGKLNQALELRHRRLRTEAAAALARLGDENGQQVLVSLAAEPVARLRVLAYAEELGIEDQIDERYATDEAIAEAELACWLAQPTQLGFPPSRLDLIEARTMYWPGYDDPVACFLFRFSYEMQAGEYAGIGIAGPVCHAFAADLADLSPDDIYAVFAGWQAEHDEIYELDAGRLTEAQQVEASRLERRMRDEGCNAIQPSLLGFFFGERVLVAHAVYDGQPRIAVAAQDEFVWLPARGSRRPPGPEEAICLFKGRRLLRAFNP